MRFSSMPTAIDAARRRFITGAALGGALAGVSRSPLAWAVTAPEARPPATAPTIDLEIAETQVTIGGRPQYATTVNGSLPGPLLHWREGEEVRIRVHNRLTVPSSIHWHGILLPAAMDGVPGLSFPGIAPGASFSYRIRPRQSGTYWYHSHSGFQEQTGLYGPLVIEPARPPALPDYQRDYVVMLNDWSEQDPETIFATLKRQSDAYNFALPDASRLWRDIRREGLSAALAQRQMWNRMRMTPTDLSDVSGYTYTYLLNGQPPGQPWRAPFKPGERLRLRFINGSAMTIFDVRIPGLKMTVISADGQPVVPVTVDEFRISVAETYDVLVELDVARAFAVFAQAIDRSGYALGELTPNPKLHAERPPMDERPQLAVVDMMGAMAANALPRPTT
ncbi:copper oxidase, partial [Lasius niger]